MSIWHAANGDVFRLERELIEVTSMSRPDVGWSFTDKAGHVHVWARKDGYPLDGYRPDAAYHVPTVEWVKTGETCYENDDEITELGELRCRQCGEKVTLGLCADTHEQYIAGPTHCYINDQPVTRDEFERRFKEAYDGSSR